MPVQRGPTAVLCALAWMVAGCGPSDRVDPMFGQIVDDGGAGGGKDGRRDGAGGAGSAAGGAGGRGGGGEPGSIGAGGVDGGEDLAASLLDVQMASDPPADLPRPDAPSGPPELTRGRVGHWKLDEGLGNVALDSSGIGNHGGTVNILAADWQRGKIGTALRFTPSRPSFVVVPSHHTLGPIHWIGVSVWVNAASWAGSPRIVQKGEDDSQYGLRAESGKLRFVLRLAAATAVETTLPPTGAWVHIAASYDGGELRLYVNGKLVAMQPATGDIAAPFTALHIGTRSQSAAESDFFNGLIDDLILYERPLSPEEVQLLSEGKSP